MGFQCPGRARRGFSVHHQAGLCPELGARAPPSLSCCALPGEVSAPEWGARQGPYLTNDPRYGKSRSPDLQHFNEAAAWSPGIQGPAGALPPNWGSHPIQEPVLSSAPPLPRCICPSGSLCPPVPLPHLPLPPQAVCPPLGACAGRCRDPRQEQIQALSWPQAGKGLGGSCSAVSSLFLSAEPDSGFPGAFPCAAPEQREPPAAASVHLPSPGIRHQHGLLQPLDGAALARRQHLPARHTAPPQSAPRS